MIYPIHERFSTFQGEGVHVGRPAFFIRTYGCPVHCPWCDSAGTWHPDWIPEKIQKMTPGQLADEVDAGPKVDFVVITGGEPTVFDLQPLTHYLQQYGYPVHLETSGSFKIHGLDCTDVSEGIRGGIDWITLSPKRWKLPLAENVKAADEFKFIIENKEDIIFYENVLLTLGFGRSREVPIWLHPEWGHREDPVVLGAISDAVKIGRGKFRAGWQLHKLYQVDVRDSRTQPLVPLGGNLMKGY